MKRQKLIFTCSTDISTVPDMIDLLPLGLVKSQKGNFTVDAESFRLMKEHMARHGVDIVVDYEHQTLEDVQAPAAGWITELVLGEKAISAKVQWNPKAREYLKNKEYRYCSPVVLARQSDQKAIQLHSVALTNTPAIEGMFAIVNSDDFETEEEDMDVKKLAQLLGLPEMATAEEVMAAIKELTATYAALKESCKKESELVVNKTIAALLEIPESAKTEEVAAKLVALKNPANFVPRAEHNAVVETLRKYECDDAVELALKSGKITPAQKDWAKAYALKDKTGFAKFVELAPAAVPMGQVTTPTKTTSADDELTAVVCKQMGLSKEDLKQYSGKDEE